MMKKFYVALFAAVFALGLAGCSDDAPSSDEAPVEESDDTADDAAEEDADGEESDADAEDDSESEPAVAVEEEADTDSEGEEESEGDGSDAAAATGATETIEGELTDDDDPLEDDSRHDAYEIDADEGAVITIDMASTDFDTFLILVGPDGNAAAHNDDNGDTSDSHIEHTIAQSGTYVIIANSYDDTGRGAYTLTYTIN